MLQTTTSGENAMRKFEYAALLAISLIFGNSSILAAAGEAAASRHLWGVAINVDNLERSVKYYTDIVGLKVAHTIPEEARTLKDAKEVIMSFDGTLASTTFTLARLDDKPQPKDKTAYGRVLFYSPDAAAVAARAKAAGYGVRQIGDKPEFFIKDPDGYDVEFFTPPSNSPFYQKP
jgi:catechol 2,3-dioxygenase-like lactoylglutathione lyase family enzyme